MLRDNVALHVVEQHRYAARAKAGDLPVLLFVCARLQGGGIETAIEPLEGWRGALRANYPEKSPRRRTACTRP